MRDCKQQLHTSICMTSVENTLTKLESLFKRASSPEVLTCVANLSPELREEYMDQFLIPLGQQWKILAECWNASRNQLSATSKIAFDKAVDDKYESLDTLADGFHLQEHMGRLKSLMWEIDNRADQTRDEQAAFRSLTPGIEAIRYARNGLIRSYKKLGEELPWCKLDQLLNHESELMDSEEQTAQYLKASRKTNNKLGRIVDDYCDVINECTSLDDNPIVKMLEIMDVYKKELDPNSSRSRYS